MHLFKTAKSDHRFIDGVLTYSFFHTLRQGVRSFKAEQWLILLCLLSLDSVLGLAAWFAWSMMLPIAILGTLPFAFVTLLIIARLIGRV